MDKELFRQYGGKTPKFSLNGIQTYARVVSIYDGDTLSLIIPLFNNYYKFSARLNGIDTYELRGKNKELALKARNRLFELITSINIDNDTKKSKIQEILNQDIYLVKINCGNFDKYGRILVDIFNNEDKNFSEILIEENLGYVYQGGAKRDDNK